VKAHKTGEEENNTGRVRLETHKTGQETKYPSQVRLKVHKTGQETKNTGQVRLETHKTGQESKNTGQRVVHETGLERLASYKGTFTFSGLKQHLLEDSSPCVRLPPCSLFRLL